MGVSVPTYALAKKYTDKSLEGLGTIKGAPCKIIGIVEGDYSNVVTFEWEGSGGTIENGSMEVKNGISIASIEVIKPTNELKVTLSDGTIKSAGIIDAQKGDKGDPGFSPVITENAGNNSNVYKLDITTETGSFTTPNLMSAGGSGDFSNYYTKAETESLISESLKDYPTSENITNNYYSKEETQKAIEEAFGDPVTDDELDSLFP